MTSAMIALLIALLIFIFIVTFDMRSSTKHYRSTWALMFIIVVYIVVLIMQANGWIRLP